MSTTTRQSLKQILMRDNAWTEAQAEAEIADAREEIIDRISNGEMPRDFCQERWNLEPDYLDDLLI